MTAEILHFTPKAEWSSNERVEEFVALCRMSSVLNAKGQFDEPIWLGKPLKGKGSKNRLLFSVLGSNARKGLTSDDLMPEPFMSFAKAMMVYLEDRRPVVAHTQRITALRCMEAALREHSRGSRPTAVDESVLDTACQLARQGRGANHSYRIAGQLELIADQMRGLGFVSLRSRWLHGEKRPYALGSRISKEAIEARQKKLPSAAAVRAVAGVFEVATGVADAIISSSMALMLCAPERVNELVRLGRNCVVDGELRFEGKLGLRWPGSKKYPDTTKWLPTRMGPIAKEAVDRLLAATKDAAEIADWYTRHPHEVFLWTEAAHLRGNTYLSMTELGLVLWGDREKYCQANWWCKEHEIAVVRHGSGRRVAALFADVERAIVGKLPSTFPYVPGDPSLLCKDALLLMRKNELSRNRASWVCMFDCIDQNDLAVRMGQGGEKGVDSIFSRYGFTEDDGSPLFVKTHAFRHYLNMLAQVGGLSDTEIAIFSGRKDLRQNRSYDHMSSDEVQAPVSAAIKSGLIGAVVDAPTRKLVRRTEIRLLNLQAAHTTEFGYCVHDFAAEPCQLHRDCLWCDEQVCVKGESHKEQSLRQSRQETAELLQRAKAALSNDEYGADAWVEHQTATLERVDELLAVFDDESVQDGSTIRVHRDGKHLVGPASASMMALPAGKDGAS